MNDPRYTQAQLDAMRPNPLAAAESALFYWMKRALMAEALVSVLRPK